MGDFKITIINKTGDSGSHGRPVNVMIFQTVSDAFKTASYFSAWVVGTIDNPGTLGPITLPEEVQFYVIEPAPDPRESGPTTVEFGQEIKVQQQNQQSPPQAIVSGTPEPNAIGAIRVINNSGNVQPLEMALYKSGKKVVSFKHIIPNEFVYLSIKPAFYVCAVEGITQGDDFKLSLFFNDSLSGGVATLPTMFALYPEKLNMKIQITQKPSGELVFSEVDDILIQTKSNIDYYI